MNIIERVKLFAAVTAVTISTCLACISFVQARDAYVPVPKVPLGSMAPDFNLQLASSKAWVRLSQLKGKPTVLVFGSGTCGFFTSHAKAIEQFYDRYKNKANIYVIYTNEMHPGGYGNSPMANNKYGMSSPFRFKEAKNMGERRIAACLVSSHFKLSIPVLLDQMDNRVNLDYSGSPVHAYIINAHGIVVFNDRDPASLLSPDMQKFFN